MKIFTLISIFLVISNLSFGKLKYEDVDKNHWAYDSINKLVENSIIRQDKFKFEGNKPVTRYEFAVFLANTFNKFDLEKADKNELKVLRKLIRDFSKELNEMGFNGEKFDEKITKSKENIENLKEQLKVVNLKMEKIEKRIQRIENKVRI